MALSEKEKEYWRKVEERRQWLISIPENESFGLEKQDWYDRIRYLRQIEGWEMLDRYKRLGVASKGPKLTKD